MTRTQSDITHLRSLLDRLARITSAEDWAQDLNPAQHAALDYLGRANRFSRAPSVVADYLGATRGTVSQTLKALHRKGLIAETRSIEDKRRVTYDVTPEGHAILQGTRMSDVVLSGLDDQDFKALNAGTTAMLTALLKQRGGRSFGICQSCRHHGETPNGRVCRLLNLPLKDAEAEQLCHEHEGR